jgi:hypothetical protein
VKFNLPTPAPRPAIDSSVRVGNVYPCKGGGKTHYWIVIGLSERTVNLLGINADGAVTSTANYGVHVFDGSSVGFSRDLLGHCGGIEALEFDVTWFKGQCA